MSKAVFFRKHVVTPSLNALALLVRIQERHPSCKNLLTLSQKFLFWRTRPNMKQLQIARLNMCSCEWWRLRLIRGSAAALFTSDLLNFCAEAYSRSVSITVRLTTMHYAVMWFDTVSCILAYVVYFISWRRDFSNLTERSTYHAFFITTTALLAGKLTQHDSALIANIVSYNCLLPTETQPSASMYKPTRSDLVCLSYRLHQYICHTWNSISPQQYLCKPCAWDLLSAKIVILLQKAKLLTVY